MLLQHVSVARSLKVVATVWNSGDELVHLSFPDGIHSGAVEGHHLILFAQEPRQGAIVGAATKWRKGQWRLRGSNRRQVRESHIVHSHRGPTSVQNEPCR